MTNQIIDFNSPRKLFAETELIMQLVQILEKAERIGLTPAQLWEGAFRVLEKDDD